MRLIKMLGLASVAAIAAMALVGASSAMAGSTQLCTADPAGQPGEVCPAGTAVTSSSGEAKNPELKNEILPVKCEKASTTATALALGAPQVFHVTALTYTNCNCKVTVEKLGLLNVLRTAVELATVESSGFEVKVECLGFFTCWYSAANPGHGLGPLVTGDNGHTTYTEAPATLIKGTGCPKSSTLNALFINTTPVYIGT